MKLTETQIKKVETDINALRNEVERQVSLKIEGKNNDDELRKANNNYQKYKDVTEFLWSDQFRDKLKSSDKNSISDAILYLEVDPWYFRSGYLKERLLFSLKRSSLSSRNRARILECFIKTMKSNRRWRVLRYYYPLLTKLFSPDQLETLMDELSLLSYPVADDFYKYISQYYASSNGKNS